MNNIENIKNNYNKAHKVLSRVEKNKGLKNTIKRDLVISCVTIFAVGLGFGYGVAKALSK